MQRRMIYCLAFLPLVIGASACSADIVQTVSNGFQTKHKIETTRDAKAAFQVFVDDFNQWWDSAHSYSGKSENLSIDLDQRCILEKLANGGFVRHLEIVYYAPGKAIRFTGGLGPLQQMGVAGALTVTFSKTDKGTSILLEYNVSGRLDQGLDKLAPAVNNVLQEQMTSLSDLLNQKPKK